MPGSPTTRARRVLTVEDEEAIRAFVDRVLSEAGYVSVVARDAGEALAIAERSDPFDLLLTDLMMPGMRGDELARQLQKVNPDLKVLYFTGYSDRLFDDRQLLRANEAFLDKPVKIEGLLEAVRLMLHGTTRPQG